MVQTEKNTRVGSLTGKTNIQYLRPLVDFTKILSEKVQKSEQNSMTGSYKPLNSLNFSEYSDPYIGKYKKIINVNNYFCSN